MVNVKTAILMAVRNVHLQRQLLLVLIVVLHIIKTLGQNARNVPSSSITAPHVQKIVVLPVVIHVLLAMNQKMENVLSLHLVRNSLESFPKIF